jgi:hypothetical protein
MDPQLATLATTGATTMVGLMVTDAWSQARDRLGRLFSRGGSDDAALAELDDARDDWLAAQEAGDAEAAAEVQEQWRLRIRQALRNDPAKAEELRQILAELAPQVQTTVNITTTNTIEDGTYNSPVIMAGQVGQNYNGPSPR